jgi:ribosomal protein S18 acetylase RimI-like enzyme
MTNDTTALDVARQYEFYEKLHNNSKLSVYLVWLRVTPCGYGIIKLDGRRACLTGGLAEPFRGKGLGRQLFHALTHVALDMGKKPWLTVLRSNQRAVRLYTKLGFHITKATKRIYTMEYRP